MNRFLAASTVAMAFVAFSGTSALAQITSSASSAPPSTSTSPKGGIINAVAANSTEHAPERGVVSLQVLQAQSLSTLNSLRQKPTAVVAVEETAMQNRPQKTVSPYKGALNLPVPANKE
jgi:hypothetical protein